MVLKEEEVFVASRKQQDSVRRETHAVSGLRVTAPSSDQHQEVDVCREKGASKAEASLRNSFDRRVSTSCKVLAPNRLV